MASPSWVWIGLVLAGAAGAAELAPVRATGALHIDGVLDEADWERAAVVEGLRSYMPDVGSVPPRTVFKVLYDDQAIYVAAEAEMAPGVPVRAPITSRDQNRGDDWVGVTIDTYNEGLKGHTFRVSARGIQADGVYVDGGDLWMQDMSWDSVYQSAGQVYEDRYVVEMAIPFRALRYPRTEVQEWTVFFTRFTPNPWAIYVWPPMDYEHAGMLGQSGRLGPFEGPAARPRVEVQPTVTGGAAQLRNRWDPWVDPGLSAKLGITSSLTADVAINPDFSQIEADEDQVEHNLKVPLYLEEKRPFFLEGAELFDTPISTLYSRSVVDPMGALKLTGRQGKVSIGVLSALDENPARSTITRDYSRRVDATGDDGALPSWQGVSVRRRALVNLLRLRQDLGTGSGVGVVYSDKELLGDERVDTLANRVGGADATVRSGRYSGGGQLLWSHTELPGGEILSGPAWTAYAARSGEVLTATASHAYFSPEFRSENGFLEEVGRIGGDFDLVWRLNDLGTFRWIGPEVNTKIAANTDGELTFASVGPAVSALYGPNVYTESTLAVKREQIFGVDLNYWGFTGFTGVDPTKDTFVGLGWDLGPTPSYFAQSTEDVFLGYTWGGTLILDATFFDRAALEYAGIANLFAEEAFADPVFTTFIHRLKATTHLTRELSVRVIEQSNSFAGELQSSALIAYQINYGTAFYLGGSDIWSFEDGESTDRTVFAKVAWLFQP